MEHFRDATAGTPLFPEGSFVRFLIGIAVIATLMIGAYVIHRIARARQFRRQQKITAAMHAEYLRGVADGKKIAADDRCISDGIETLIESFLPGYPGSLDRDIDYN